MAAPLRLPLLPALLAGGLLSAAAAAFQGGDVRAALERLEAPEAAERLAAERWLGRHLAPSDLPELAQRGATAPTEALRRLERVLGSDERHLELVGLLLTDKAPAARALGEAALRRLAAGWLGDEGIEPAPPLRVLGALTQRGAAEYRLELGEGSLAPRLERVVRLASGGVGRRAASERLDVALDPQLAGSRLRAGPPVPASVDGDFLTLIFALTGIQGLEVEGFGLDRLEGRHAWLHVTSSELSGRRPADQLLAAWMRQLLGSPEAAERRAAARALAGSGWSAGLAWLERRWLERGDGAALEGLALAAARGRVVPTLATPQAVRRLLGELDAALDEAGPEGQRRADRARFALAALPALGADGSDLSALVAGGLELAAPRAAFVRLAVLAGMGVVPDAVRVRLRRQLEDPRDGAPPFVRLEALRALAASRPITGEEPWGRLAQATALLELAAQFGQEGALSTWMRSAHLAPPEAWRDPASLPPRWRAWMRLLVAEAWLAFPGGGETASAHLAELGDEAWSDPRVEQRLRRLAAGPLRDELTTALAPEPEGLGPRARLALLCGLLPAELHPRALSALVSEGGAEEPGGDLLLGALAAGPVRAGAVTALLARAGLALEAQPSEQPRLEPWARACERAWGERLAAGLDGEAEDLRGDLVRLLREVRYPSGGPGSRRGRERGHPLAGELARRRWPRLVTTEVVPLTELESPIPGS